MYVCVCVCVARPNMRPNRIVINDHLHSLGTAVDAWQRSERTHVTIDEGGPRADRRRRRRNHRQGRIRIRSSNGVGPSCRHYCCPHPWDTRHRVCNTGGDASFTPRKYHTPIHWAMETHRYRVGTRLTRMTSSTTSSAADRPRRHPPQTTRHCHRQNRQKRRSVVGTGVRGDGGSDYQYTTSSLAKHRTTSWLC